MVSKSPVVFLGLPPVVESEHDGEGAGGQQLPSVLVLLVLVVKAVGRCQCKSVSNLGREKTKIGNKSSDELTNTAEHLLLTYWASMSSSRRSAAIQG